MATGEASTEPVTAQGVQSGPETAGTANNNDGPAEASTADSASLSTQIQDAIHDSGEQKNATDQSSPPVAPSEAAAPTEVSVTANASEPQPLSATPRDPAVDQLHALFPDVDLEIIETVLAASGGSLDEATEQLLILSDPTYKPDPVELQQLEADEEFARQLAQEDEAAAAEQRRRREAVRSQQASTPAYATPGAGGEGLSRPLSYQPYVPKSRRNTGNPGMSALSPTISPSSTSWEPPAHPAQAQDRTAETQTRDELAEIGEQISKFAEQGKKTFSSLFSKVKEGVAKMDDAIVRSASPPTEYSAPPPLPRKDTYSPFPSPSLATAGPSSSAPQAQPPRTTISVVPDRLPRPDSYTSARSVSPQPATAPRVASPTFGSSESKDRSAAASPSTLKPVAKVPGFLPRQSFSLLDADKQKSSTNPTEPTKGSGTQETSAGESAAADAAADGQRPRKESSGLLSAPNHRLEDSDDDELEYSRSPFEDDD